MNVCATVGLSATMGEMSTTVGEISTIVLENLRVSFLTLHRLPLRIHGTTCKQLIRI